MAREVAGAPAHAERLRRQRDHLRGAGGGRGRRPEEAAGRGGGDGAGGDRGGGLRRAAAGDRGLVGGAPATELHGEGGGGAGLADAAPDGVGVVPVRGGGLRVRRGGAGAADVGQRQDVLRLPLRRQAARRRRVDRQRLRVAAPRRRAGERPARVFKPLTTEFLGLTGEMRRGLAL